MAVVRRDVALRAGDAVVGNGARRRRGLAELGSAAAAHRRLPAARARADADVAAAAPLERPLLARYGSGGRARDEGPTLRRRSCARLRRTERPSACASVSRGPELLGEVRAARDGYRLVAIPLPDFFDRLLTAALLIPAIASSSWRPPAPGARGDGPSRRPTLD